MPAVTSTVGSLGWIDPHDIGLDEFRTSIERATDPADHPYADSIEQRVPVYGDALRRATRSAGGRRQVQVELARVLLEGPGVFVVRGAFKHAVVDRATEQFEALIAAQKEGGGSSGDHFAAPGANDRVWGALDKLAVRAPEVFVDYYGNDVLALVCEAWLGPGYQLTSQVNVVNPGGQAQVPHTDYHLGFMSPDQARSYPAHVHALSPALTLQGAVAHCDMPVETGPTMYLPFSQRVTAGYVACHQPDLIDYFTEHHVQPALATGDAAFFNPRLMHGAGTNRTPDVRRMANLLQVSSPFGRAMEAVDRTAIVKAVYPVLVRRRAAGVNEAQLHAALAAAAEGYAFPTDLDRDQPTGGLAPETQAHLVWHALELGWDADTLGGALDAHAARRAGSVGC